eukprot:scaffold181443_cov33-Tisochrysis_lutea.AAC.2
MADQRVPSAIIPLYLPPLLPGVPTGYDDPQNQPKYPGNPPLWVERYRVIKALLAPDGDKNGDDLDRSSRGLATHGDGYVWRLEKARPIGIEESGKGGVTHDDLVMKHAMLSRACKCAPTAPEPGLGQDASHALIMKASRRGLSPPLSPAHPPLPIIAHPTELPTPVPLPSHRGATYPCI